MKIENVLNNIEFGLLIPYFCLILFVFVVIGLTHGKTLSQILDELRGDKRII